MTDALRPSAIADDSGHGGLQMFVTAGPTSLVADVKVEACGLDLGPDPHDLVAAGLAACTTMTLRLYAERKNWPLGAVHVEVRSSREADMTPPERFDREITLDGDLDAEQRERLLAIAEMCPIHKLLSQGARIVTTVG
ncbi:OsmC family protein [Caulobacter sp. ErkDOM-YI]|uniref:OsmC family protein n=1 Tax=unclassified Caulobacter TaxID=2648921 RepID=UPI003AF56374